jgi:hypothetical protein
MSLSFRLPPPSAILSPNRSELTSKQLLFQIDGQNASKGNLFRGNEAAWWTSVGIDGVAHAQRLWQRTPLNGAPIQEHIDPLLSVPSRRGGHFFFSFVVPLLHGLILFG